VARPPGIISAGEQVNEDIEYEPAAVIDSEAVLMTDPDIAVMVTVWMGVDAVVEILKLTEVVYFGTTIDEGKLRPVPVDLMLTGIPLDEVTLELTVIVHVAAEPAGTDELHVNEDSDWPVATVTVKPSSTQTLNESVRQEPDCMNVPFSAGRCRSRCVAKLRRRVHSCRYNRTAPQLTRTDLRWLVS
jgi:hypothetical protein